MSVLSVFSRFSSNKFSKLAKQRNDVFCKRMVFAISVLTRAFSKFKCEMNNEFSAQLISILSHGTGGWILLGRYEASNR